MNENIDFIFDYKGKAMYKVTDLVNGSVYFRVYLNDIYHTQKNFTTYVEAYKFIIN